MQLGRRNLLPLIAAGATLTAALGRPAAAMGLDAMLRDKKLRIGYINAPPGARKDPNSGEIGGLYVDAVQLILGQVNIEPVWIETNWSTFVAGLQADQFDMCIAGTFATVARATAVEFVKPICYMGMSAVVKTGDTRFSKLTDLDREDITIAAVLGDAAVEFIRQNFPKAKLVTLGTSNLAAPFVEVSAGRADVGIEDAYQAHHYAESHPEVKDMFGNQPFNVLPIAWTVKRGNIELLNFMNTGIDWLLVNDRFSKVAAKYGSTGRYIMRPEFVPLGNG
ncbi:MAG TPA: ABC transporter substrate-binding protein [Rhodopila sp.]